MMIKIITIMIMMTKNIYNDDKRQSRKYIMIRILFITITIMMIITTVVSVLITVSE